MDYFYSVSLALFLTLALMPFFLRASARLGLVDVPTSERKIHDRPMARTGGLAIIIGSFVPLALLLPLDGGLINVFLGAVIIAFFGLLDDRVELNFKWKLFGQGLAAAAAMAGGVLIQQFPFVGLQEASPFISYPLTFVFLVGVINGVNFSDGLDGLAGGMSIMALLLVFLLAFQSENQAIALIALTVAGAVFGFLKFNAYPAQIFMGDAGSQLLGYLIACLAILVTQYDQAAYSPLLPVLILGIPIMDIIQVLPVRFYKKLPWPGPDKEHFHHQLGKIGFRHYEVVVIVYLLQVALLIAAYLMRFDSDASLLLFYSGFLAIVLGLLFYANFTGWRFRSRQRQKTPVERRNRLLRKVSWLYFYTARIVTGLVLVFILLSLWFLRGAPSDLGHLCWALFALFTLLTLVLGRKWLDPITRLSGMAISLLIAYQLSALEMSAVQELCLATPLALLVAFMGLAIRMTRKAHYMLNTQDLLLLLGIVLLPLLPFESLSLNSVGFISLLVFVLYYAFDFIITTGKGTVAFINGFSILSMGMLGFFSLG